MSMKRVLVFAFHAPYFLRTAINTPARRSLSTTTIMSAASNKNLVVDPFCFRQFAESDASQSYGGTVFSNKISEFEDIVNARFDEHNLKDGYAPFCKHLFVVNDFTDGRVNVLPLSKENEHLVRTEYVARNDKELPVLQRFIPVDLVVGGVDDLELPVSKYLDLILYSREQIIKENQSMDKEASVPVSAETAPWGIVSIKAQDVDYELPMNPITVMRNSLGKDEGGSGIPIDRDAYMEAVNYWKANVVVS
jgi:hypothetical protein